MQSLSETRSAPPLVLVLAPRLRDTFGEPSPLLSPFGPEGTLLDVTLLRLATAALGPITVCCQNADTAIADTVRRRGLDVAVGTPGMTLAEIAADVLARSEAQLAILVDGRAAFVSASVLRLQLEARLETGAELTFAPLAARGLGGIVAATDALQRLARAHVNQLALDMSSDLFEFAERARVHFRAADVDVAEEFSCLSVNLIPRTLEEARHLRPHVLDARSENYDPVFDSESRREWNRWTVAPGGAPVPDRAKLMFVNYNGNTYGSTRLLSAWLEIWDKDRFEIVVCEPAENELLARTSEKFRAHYVPTAWPNVEFQPHPNRSWSDRLARCQGVLEEEKPDLVFLHGFVPVMAIACRLMQIPSICFAQTPAFSQPPLFCSAILRSAGIPVSDLVVSCAESYERAMRQAFRPPPGRMVTAANGIDLQIFDPAKHDRASCRQKLRVPRDAAVILFASALSPHKRPMLALEAFHLVHRDVPEAYLVIAGGDVVAGGFQPHIEERAREMGVLDRVRFAGYLEDMAAFYAAGDVLLHTAMVEPFGLTVIEAMAMERPVVGMDLQGPGETIVHGQTGFKIGPPEDPADIADALKQILTQPALAERLGTAARRRTQDRYDIREQVRTLERLCIDTIARRAN